MPVIDIFDFGRKPQKEIVSKEISFEETPDKSLDALYDEYLKKLKAGQWFFESEAFEKLLSRTNLNKICLDYINQRPQDIEERRHSITIERWEHMLEVLKKIKMEKNVSPLYIKERIHGLIFINSWEYESSNKSWDNLFDGYRQTILSFDPIIKALTQMIEELKSSYKKTYKKEYKSSGVINEP